MTVDELLVFQTLRRLSDSAVGSQRTLADELGVSLGRANYLIRALVDRELVKLENVSRSPNRVGYLYVLTPKGVTEKAKLTRRFLKRKLEEYERLQQEIDTLAREAGVIDMRAQQG